MVTLKCTATVAAEHSAADCKLLKLSKLSIVKTVNCQKRRRCKFSPFQKQPPSAAARDRQAKRFSPVLAFQVLEKNSKLCVLISSRKTFLKSLQLKLDEHPFIVVLVHFRPTNRRDSFRPVDLLSVDLQKPIILLFRLVDIPHLVLLVGNIAILASRDFSKISIATSPLYFLL